MTPNQVIADRYKIERKIGEGGMGIVYRGLDLDTQRPVAIKILTAERNDDEYQEILARFIREGDVLRRLDHPNIVQILDVVEEAEHRFIIMELVKGGSLYERLKRYHPLPIEQVVAIMLELADALARAHHLNIIHRDIKPGNILLAEDDTPRLTDFGISYVAGQSRMTASGQVVGTLSYISPELLRNAPPDPRSDIWAFGVLLLELLTNTRPFDRAHTVATIQAILTERPPDLEKLRPDTPLALVDLIYRMLEKVPERRIPSMRMVGAELEAIHKGQALPVVMQREINADDINNATGTLQDIQNHTLPTRLNYTLPIQATPFIGREHEIDDIAQLLQDASIRLVTILGVGGMGKTRLSLQAAETVKAGFQHGACFIPLAPLDSPDLMVAQLAESLRHPFYEHLPPRQQILDYLRDKNLLLVFDNFEHVLEGADLVADILTAAPHVKILATSRERLALQGETIYQLGGMELPSESSLSLQKAKASAAVRLFIQAAQRDQPAFILNEADLPHLMQIGNLVQGMPLALELAAGWAEMLSLREIAQEIEKSLDFLESNLRDIPERHRSIRAVFEYSWQLLSEVERTIFRRLAVFRGGFNRDAALEVAEANLRALQALTNKSLIRRHPNGRYEVHELLRQYAENALDADELRKVQDRHMRYFASFLAANEQDLKGGRQTEAALGIEQELQNIRAAWQHAATTGNFEAVGQSLESLNRFYDMQTRFEEGETLLREAAQQLRPHATTPHDELTLARLLACLAWFTRRVSTPAASRRIAETSLKILNALSARPETAFPLNTLGCLARDEQNYPLANQFLSESLTVYRENGDHWGLGFTLYALGDSAYQTGDWSLANRHFEESIEICRAIGDHNGMAWAYIGMGGVAIKQGEFSRARSLYGKSLDHARKLGFRAWVEIEALQRLGWLAWRHLEAFTEALNHFQNAQKIIQNYGTRQQSAHNDADLGLVYLSLFQYVDAFAHFRQSLTTAYAIDAKAPILKVIIGLAVTNSLSPIASADKLTEAAQWLAFAAHTPHAPADLRSLASEYLGMVRLALNPAQYNAILESATTLSFEQLRPVLIQTLR